jgi:CheY-like chemotaxis protein
VSGLSVLVVDDNATNRQILEHHLTAWGVRYASAEGAAQGLALVREAAARGERFDVALLDFFMPEMDGVETARILRADPANADLKLVMLTSIALRGHSRTALAAGIDSYLTKPVRESHLRRCIAELGGRAGAPERREEPPQSEEAAPAKRTDRPLILVAEDNIVNQRVLTRILDKLGYRSDVAANGHEAVQAYSRRPYAAVLMDVQMPEMDGFDAARLIRERESATGLRCPIIAVTANALEGDRERCIECGMDDYLSKPVKPAALRAALERWVPVSPPRGDAESASLEATRRTG